MKNKTREKSSTHKLRPDPNSFFLAIFLGGLILLPTLWYFISGDQGLYAYIGWLWHTQHLPPYVGGFDQQLPGIYFLNYLIFKIFSPTVFSIRLFDYLVQILNIALIYYFARLISPGNNGSKAGLLGSLLYAAYYLTRGPLCTVLKDGFVLTPLLIAGFLFVNSSKKWKWIEPIGVGLMIGISFIIKPTFGLAGLVFAVLYLIKEKKANSSWIKISAFESLLIFFSLIPFLVILGFLSYWGVIDKFKEAFIGFNKSGLADYVFTTKYWDYVAYQIFRTSPMIWFGAFLFILLQLSRNGWRDDERNQPKILLFALFSVCGLSIFIQGKAWSYHIIPAAGFASILAGSGFCWLSDLLIKEVEFKLQTWVKVLLIICIVSLQIAGFQFRDIVFIKRNIFKPLAIAYSNQGPALEAAEYLKERTKPDDKIFFWGRLLQIAFISQRPSPTRHIYSFYTALGDEGSFSPIQIKWQKEMVEDLKANPPVYFVVSKAQDELTPRFDELLPRVPGLQEFLEQNYGLETIIRKDYLIYRLKKE